jgi:hypothetical protein
MAAKSAKFKLKDLQIKCVTMNKNRDSDFLGIHQGQVIAGSPNHTVFIYLSANREAAIAHAI